MESNLIKHQTNNRIDGFTTSNAVLNHWQGHRRLTRRVIEAFPEDKLFTYTIGGMRPFAEMVKEIINVADQGIQDLFKNEQTPVALPGYYLGKSFARTKSDILNLWDDVTYKIDNLWPLIPQQRFREKMLAFGACDGITSNIVFYWIDKEIRHRSQGCIYLSCLGIEPCLL